MRKSRGFGAFITREQIEEEPARDDGPLPLCLGSQALRENGTPTVVSARLGPMSFCPVRYYIDGTSYPLYGQSIDSMVQPADIGAIEIYPGARRCRSSAGESACGVVAIWTRQGVRKQK
jgi:hypothetical protein